MKTNYTKSTQQLLFFGFCFLLMAQLSYSQKNSQSTKISKGITVPAKANNVICNCNSTDFKVRIIKLTTAKAKRTYKLQIIDFVNKSNCDIKFLNLNWKGQQMIPMTSMRNPTFEKATDGSTALYEFEFDTKTNAQEPEDGAEIETSIQIKIGTTTCLLKNKPSTYLSKI